MPNDYYCSVSHCKYSNQNNNNDGYRTAQRKKNDANEITFHDLPSDVELSKQWLKNIHKNNWLLSPAPKICSLHFAADCFEAKNGRLKKRAVPTIFAEQDDRKNHIRIYSRCVVPNCRKSSIAKSAVLPNNYVTLHSLPVQDHEKLKQWICALQLDPAFIETATKDMVVCSDHFAKKDFKFSNKTTGWGGLKEDAVPFPLSDQQQDIDILSVTPDNIHSKPPKKFGASLKTLDNEVVPLLKECQIRLNRCDNLMKRKISVEGKVKDEVIEPNEVPMETSSQWEQGSEQNKPLRESFVDPLWPSRATTSKRPSEDSTNGIIFESGLHDKESAPSLHSPIVPVSLHMATAPPLHNESATDGFQSEMQYTVSSTCLNMLYVKCEQCEEHVAMSKGNSNFDGSTLAVRCICLRGHETIWYSQPQVPTPGLCNWVPSSCETMELLPDGCVMLPNDD